jgi:hypothetical protein
VQPAAPTDNIIVLKNFQTTNDMDSTSYTDEFDDIQQLDDASVVDASLSLSFCSGKKGTAQFTKWSIAGT